MTERLREIEQRCEKATPGPWEIKHEGYPFNCDSMESPDKKFMMCNIDYYPYAPDRMEDWQFIAHAREDIPYILGVIKEQAEEIERLQSLVGGPHLCEAAKTVGCMCTGQCFNFKQSKIETP